MPGKVRQQYLVRGRELVGHLLPGSSGLGEAVDKYHPLAVLEGSGPLAGPLCEQPSETKGLDVQGPLVGDARLHR